jgi:hypothetical protein
MRSLGAAAEPFDVDARRSGVRPGTDRRVWDGLAGAARLGGGALADDPHRRRTAAVGGYTTTAVLSGLIGVATSAWQAGILRAAGWATRGLRVPSRNALLADVVPAHASGRAYGFERAMDNLGAIIGPLLAIAPVGLVGVRTAILLSIVPGLLAVAAILYLRPLVPRCRRYLSATSASVSRSLVGFAAGVSAISRRSSASAWRRVRPSRAPSERLGPIRFLICRPLVRQWPYHVSRPAPSTRT